MKKITTILSMSALMASCSSYYEIENAKQLSNGRIDKKVNYEQLSVANGSTKKEIKRSDARTIDTAIARLLRKVPGGKYVTNAKVYVVKRNYLAVSGNVWGDKADDIKPMIAVRKSSSFNDSSK